MSKIRMLGAPSGKINDASRSKNFELTYGGRSSSGIGLYVVNSYPPNFNSASTMTNYDGTLETVNKKIRSPEATGLNQSLNLSKSFTPFSQNPSH
jgi:hypothetical protein